MIEDMKKLKHVVEAKISVEKKRYDWGKMVTVHHGSDTSYPLHPDHQRAIKKLRPGMKTTFKDETGATVHAHREGDTVHLHRPRTSSTLTSVPYHHFDEGATVVELPVNGKGENAENNNAKRRGQDATMKVAGLYQRRQKDVVEQINPYHLEENLISEGYSEEDIAKGGTVIYKHGGKHYMSKVSHITGGGMNTKIHTTSKLGHEVLLHHVVSTDASDWNKFRGRGAGVQEAVGGRSTEALQRHWDSHRDEERPAPAFAAHLGAVGRELARRKKQKEAKVQESVYTDPAVGREMKAIKKEYEHKAKHFQALERGDSLGAGREHKRMKKFQSIANAINRAHPKTSYGPSNNSDVVPGSRRMD